MLSQMIMRQSSSRCFGQMFNGINGQTSQSSITKFVGLASAASPGPLNLSAGNPNSLSAKVAANVQVQRWITTLQAKKPNNSTNAIVTRAMSSNHPQIWTAEKLVSLAMVPAIIGPFMWTTPLTDAIFCTLGVLHSHWGIEAIVVDYVRPSLFGGNTIIPNIAQALVWALSAFTLGALYYFAYTDVGIVNAIKMLWKV